VASSILLTATVAGTSPIFDILPRMNVNVQKTEVMLAIVNSVARGPCPMGKTDNQIPHPEDLNDLSLGGSNSSVVSR